MGRCAVNPMQRLTKRNKENIKKGGYTSAVQLRCEIRVSCEFKVRYLEVAEVLTADVFNDLNKVDVLR